MSSKKRPQYSSQLILAVVLLLGSSFAYWYEYSKKPKDDAANEEASKPLNLKGIAISTIRLENQERKLTLACLDLDKGLCKPGDNSHWALKEPIQFKADDSTVSALVSTLNNLKPETTIDLSTDTPEKRRALLEEYRLSNTAHERKDAKSVTITAQDGSTYVLHLGVKHPIQAGSFALVVRKGVPEESKIYVIPPHQITSIDQPIPSFRNKQMLSLAQADVTELEISGGKKSAKPVVAKKDGVNWSVSERGSVSAPGDNDSIESLVSGAIFLNANGFSADSKNDPRAKSLLAQSRKALKLELRTKSGAQALTLYERKYKDGSKEAIQVYATVSDLDPLYQVETTALDRLDKGLSDLRITRLIPTMARFDLGWIEIEGKGFTQTIEKSDNAWKLKGGDLENARLDALLDRLTSNAIQSTLPKSGKAVDPQVRIAFGPKPADRKFEFTFFRKDGHTYAIDEKSATKETYQLQDSIVGTIPWDENAFKRGSSPNPTKPSEAGHGHSH